MILKYASNHCRFIATLISLIFSSILLHAQLPVKELRFKSHSFNHTFGFSSDNKFLVTNGKGWICPSDTFDIKVWDVDHETVVNTFIGHRCNISSVTFSPDNKLVISASTDGNIKWWNLKTNDLEKSLALKEKIISAVFTSQGKYLVLLSVKEVPVPNKSNSFRIENNIHFVDNSTGKIIKNFKGGISNYTENSLRFSSDDNYFAYSNGYDFVVQRTETGEVIKTSKFNPISNSGQSVDFSPNSKYLATAGPNDTIKLWNTSNFAIDKYLISGNNAKAHFLTFSPDSKYIASIEDVEDDPSIKIWDVENGTQLNVLSDTAQVLKFSPDGKYLIASTGNKIKFWLVSDIVAQKSGPKYPPRLIIKANSVSFKALNSSGQLDAGEEAVVTFTVINQGKYVGKKLKLNTNLTLKSKNGDNSNHTYFDTLYQIATSNMYQNWSKELFFEEMKKIDFKKDVYETLSKYEKDFKISEDSYYAKLNSKNEIQIISYPYRVLPEIIEAGKEYKVEIRLKAGLDIPTDQCKLTMQVIEPNGFDSPPVEIDFITSSFKKPKVLVVDGIFSAEGGGNLKVNQATTLEVLVQNIGEGKAQDVSAVIKLPTNVINLGESEFKITTLKSGESSKINFQFIATARYSKNEIPIEIILNEKYKKYSSNKIFTVPLNQILNTTKYKVENGNEQSNPIALASLHSDVDKDIPVIQNQLNSRYALIIGNEDYKKYQMGLHSDQNVLFARNDALVFREYLIKTLGVPEKQTFMLTDATRAQMSRELERITQLVKMTPNAELVFYYAGHGLPDIETQQGYLIPVDVTASNLKDAISLKELYSKLASSKASKTLVFLDACFSGGGRGENGLLAARTVKVKPKGDIIEGNIVAFTASSGEEVSLPLIKEYHGLFTYYLLKKIKDTQGQLTLEQLKTYLESEVPKASLIENGIRQTPQVLVAPDLSDKWLSWKLQN